NFSTRFGSACSRGDSAIIELLLRSGADVNARDDDSNTPLHLASRTGQLELILLLLDNGAHPHVQNNDLKTPLDLVRETVDMFLSADDYDDPADFERCNKIIAVLSVTPSVPLTAES
ncbi:ankyrin, partial [Paxillus ammoniavirescens]